MKNFGTAQILRWVMATVAAALLFSAEGRAQSAEGKTMTPEDYAAKEAERLESLLALEGWQTFYVDSTLQHNYVGLQDELNELKSAKVDNYDLYQAVQDKWMEKTDSAFQKWFTPEQWSRYLKNGAAKRQKARAKRAAK